MSRFTPTVLFVAVTVLLGSSSLGMRRKAAENVDFNEKLDDQAAEVTAPAVDVDLPLQSFAELGEANPVDGETSASRAESVVAEEAAAALAAPAAPVAATSAAEEAAVAPAVSAAPADVTLVAEDVPAELAAPVAAAAVEEETMAPVEPADGTSVVEEAPAARELPVAAKEATVALAAPADGTSVVEGALAAREVPVTAKQATVAFVAPNTATLAAAEVPVMTAAATSGVEKLASFAAAVAAAPDAKEVLTDQPARVEGEPQDTGVFGEKRGQVREFYSRHYFAGRGMETTLNLGTQRHHMLRSISLMGMGMYR